MTPLWLTRYAGDFTGGGGVLEKSAFFPKEEL